MHYWKQQEEHLVVQSGQLLDEALDVVAAVGNSRLEGRNRQSWETFLCLVAGAAAVVGNRRQ